MVHPVANDALNRLNCGGRHWLFGEAGSKSRTEKIINQVK